MQAKLIPRRYDIMPSVTRRGRHEAKLRETAKARGVSHMVCGSVELIFAHVAMGRVYVPRTGGGAFPSCHRLVL